MSRVIHKFTRNVPQWQPRVTPVKLADATQAQLDALQVTPSNTKVSAYVLTLAHDVESLSVRSPLFNAIMYDPGGMSRAERELGALAASISRNERRAALGEPTSFWSTLPAKFKTLYDRERRPAPAEERRRVVRVTGT